MSRRTVLALAMFLVTASAAAAPVYRCGAGIYSQTPCPGGRVVESTDPRTAAQRAEARRVQAAERKAAQKMERDRLALEKKGKQAPAVASLGPVAAASAATRDGEGQRAKRGEPKPDSAGGKDFTAVVPGGKAAASP